MITPNDIAIKEIIRNNLFFFNFLLIWKESARERIIKIIHKLLHKNNAELRSPLVYRSSIFYLSQFYSDM